MTVAGSLDLLAGQDVADLRSWVIAAGMVVTAVAVRVVLWVVKWIVTVLVPVAVVGGLVYLVLHAEIGAAAPAPEPTHSVVSTVPTMGPLQPR